LVVAGNAETKALQEMMPDILKQVGPKQYQFLKSQLSNLDSNKAAENDDDDDVPNLVGTFEDAGKK
jgi:nascent polypeptide-associated complex subunit beta